MSLPRYPAYKDSGVEWLGEVPEHWEVKKLKNIASFAGGGTPSRENLDFWGGPIPWVSPKDMKAEKITQAEEGITQEGLDGSPSSLIAPGHVLLVVRSGILRHTIPVAINAVEVALNQDMKAIRLNGEICSCSFLLRWIQGFNDQLLLVWGKQGATVESIEQDYLSRSLVPLPPLSEQHAITIFLDRETAKIDALIAEQQRLIELLQEKRQAVISHAVTKGLNPDAPMKDSGVEWLGEVPEHWEVLELKHLKKERSSITYGIVQAGPHIDDGIPYIRTSDMAGDQLRIETCQRTSADIDEAYARSRVEAGDLVIAIRATVGKTLEVPTELHGANLTQGTAKFSPCAKVNAKFVKASFDADYCQSQIMSSAKGATFLEITLDALRRLRLVMPPVEEQGEIAQYLAVATSGIRELLLAAEQTIGLLQERRSALISAAVTGQIDVRGLVPEAVAA
jgi:type I restriction enzyme S subunit